MTFIETMLRKTAEMQRKHAAKIMAAVVLITIFFGYGLTKVSIQSDFYKEMPQDLPIFVLNNKINDRFGGQDIILLLFTLDDNTALKGGPKDIRNPDMMKYLISLENELSGESSIESVTSAGTYLKGLPQTDSALSEGARSSTLSGFFSEDYTKTIMYITADVGSGEEKIKSLTGLIDDKINGLSTPAGVKATVTGTPTLNVIILDMLKRDALFTILLASAIILLLLFIMKRSVAKGLLIFSPIGIGLVWTMGMLGWLGIPLSIATVGIGAMILGLGVEYGVFMLSRYEEERQAKRGQADALREAVPSIGSAILGSGLTTIAGFIALTLSLMPLLQKLGISLALGIFFSLFAAVFIMPAIIVLEEDFHYWHTHFKHSRLEKKKRALGGMPR